ncbi:MAG TPA: VanZ family protein [Noviherbaspirillum sp.]|jgi:VanZ family protein|uniref:VanZ family protein n=1 Tax=Noviherbaspirillum sp. TaxID=1926288 RepID=UPI002F94BF2E
MRILHLLLEWGHERSRLYAALVLYGAVLTLGAIPGARHEVGHFLPGLVLHAVTYAAIAFLLFTGFRASAWTRGIRTVSCVAVMGAIDELMQSFLPYRTGAIGDWAIDVASGMVMSAVLVSLYARRAATQRVGAK